jgi:protein-S-isoprenylcysteine O-methyltransferase Ste14
MQLAVPIGILQLWAFSGSGLLFFVLLLQRLSRRRPEAGGKRDRRSQLGIAIQSLGIAIVALGPVRPTLAPLSVPAVVGTAAVLVLMGGAIGLFAASSRELGRNWSLVARMRDDHQLVRTGPYARVRHPIYLGMLLFLLAFAVGLGHWAELVIALPVFLAGTAIRTRLEDGLLEQQFGEEFRDYRSATPALIPRI